MKRETKGWSKERRLKQAENCRRLRPSKQSTGPKTPTGKAASSHNAFKHGARSAEFTELRRLLRMQRDSVKSVIARHRP